MRIKGRSPRVIAAPTLGDGLSAYYGGQARSHDGGAGHPIADALTDLPGIELAVETSRLPADGPRRLLDQVANNHHVTRSGDIYIIQEPYWFLFDKGPVAAMHGSPWRYDTHVPIIFAGPGIRAESVHRPVHPVDVAPTIAGLLGMSPPASARGTPLREVLH